MDLNQLRTFVAIAQEGNLTRASETLYLSQPAVSAQIKALEDELGLKLFHRAVRGMELTSAGKILFDEASMALGAARKVVARAQMLREGVSGEFRLGTIAEPLILRLGEFLTHLASRHPDLRLSLSQGISGDVVDWVLDGRIDAGYIIGANENPRIAAVKVAPITLRVVAPASWADRIIGRDWGDIARLPWISTPAKCSFSRLAVDMFARHGLAPQTVLEADQEQTLRGLVASGIGLTLLREDVALNAQAAGELVIWAPAAEISHLWFIYLREKEDIPVLQAVLGVVRDVWKLGQVPHPG
ncbi:LysR family transcriptional regulator [Ferrovum sp.]|uniref:LysR family transcriptional regulator n=1 Tax=Ferrovum sp. TaxID=2609467 RepID=UPI002626537E|nr:LysR family transcriptional regulator [Ferrovum sp.]